MVEGKFVKHGPCDKCGSSDARAEYTDHAYCFSCNTYFGDSGAECSRVIKPKGDLIAALPRDLGARAISQETCAKFGYGVGKFKDRWVQVAPYYDSQGRMVAQKIRFPNKDFLVLGDMKQATLFGQNLWRDGGRMIVVTEGEIDALSVSQAQNNKWPVVSIPSGAQGAVKAVRKNLEWLEKFDSVVFMFDMDEPGQEAARACAEVLSPHKGKIAALPLKDANEMLKAGRSAEIIDALWGAKEFRPDGIVADEDVWRALRETKTAALVPFPWAKPNEYLLGLRTGELLTLCAGSGIGKSLVCRELAYHLIREGRTVGYIALEESVKRSAQGLLSVALNRPLHLIRQDEYTDELWKEIRAAYEETIAGGKVYFFDHWGSLDSEELLAKIRYMAKGLGCEYIFLDHISIVVSGIDNGDERKAIDVTMTALRSLVQETGVGLILVSHLRRPDGNKGHEDGQQITLAHLRGSAAIAQLSDTVLGLERDQQDPESKNVTLVRGLKDRLTGFTGPIGTLVYDPKTGRLSEGVDFDTIQDDNHDTDF